MKEILCFGDSNTYGLIPGTTRRYDRETRWTGILAEKLYDKGYRIIEEGLCGRTSVFDDATRDGKKIIVYCPESKYSKATQNPRKDSEVAVLTEAYDEMPFENAPSKVMEDRPMMKPLIVEDDSPKEKTIDVQYGDIGYGYDAYVGAYINNQKTIEKVAGPSMIEFTKTMLEIGVGSV